MYVSAATMLGADPGDPGEHSYTELLDALRQHGSQPAADSEELWRRIAFSILITNVDDHLLNHGFLHVDRGQWQLAPAFDLNPFPEQIRELKTWVSEEAGPEATVDALMSVTAYFRIAKARATIILGEVEAAVATWRKEGRALRDDPRGTRQFRRSLRACRAPSCSAGNAMTGRVRRPHCCSRRTGSIQASSRFVLLVLHLNFERRRWHTATPKDLDFSVFAARIW